METIRALSLYQPWAELIASGQKTIETRDWRGDRGRSLVGQRIAIHAAKKLDPGWVGPGAREYALGLFSMARGAPLDLPDDLATLPRGAVVATAHVAAVRRLNGLIDSRAACCECDGLVGIVLTDVLRVDPPFCVLGHRGIFILPAAEIFRRSTRPLPFPATVDDKALLDAPRSQSVGRLSGPVVRSVRSARSV